MDLPSDGEDFQHCLRGEAPQSGESGSGWTLVTVDGHPSRLEHATRRACSRITTRRASADRAYAGPQADLPSEGGESSSEWTLVAVDGCPLG
ncbi:hypothetical protein ACP26L_09995 [Paenibacillus sp. S-38]|uniref:hypothetical protein n=1 Tax=Paenibacillus sp. S-38 TaxID=3416710 RepID=UPI003CEEE51D